MVTIDFFGGSGKTFLMNDYTNRFWCQYFEPHIIERGEGYYRQERVKAVHIEDAWVRGIVLGSKTYYPTIDVRSDGSLFMVCDCPYDDYCKHLVALLLELTDRYERGTLEKFVGKKLFSRSTNENLAVVLGPSDDDDDDDYDYDDDDDDDMEEPLSFSNVTPLPWTGTIELDPRRMPSQRKWRSDQGDRKTSAHQPGAFRLVFLLSLMKERYQPAYTVVPALRYCKKDGTYGRIEPYKSEREYVGHNEPNGALLHHCFDPYTNKPTWVPVWLLLPLLKNHPEIPLYHEETMSAIRFLPVDQATVTFSLHTFSGKTPLFSPRVETSDPAVDTPAVIDNGENMRCGHNMTHMVLPSGTVLEFEGRKVTEFLRELFRGNSHFSVGDIDTVRGQLRRLRSSQLRFRFGKKTVRGTVAEFQPVIFAQWVSSLLTLRFAYKYHDTIIPVTSKAAVLHLPKLERKKSEIVVAFRAPQAEAKALSAAEKILPPDQFYDLTTSAEISVNETSYYFAITREDFFRQYAPKLLEAGFEISLLNGSRLSRRTQGRLQLRVNTGIDWFDIKAGVDSADAPYDEVDVSVPIGPGGIVQTTKGMTVLTPEDCDLLRRLQEKRAGKNTNVCSVSALDFPLLEKLAPACCREDSAKLDRPRQLYRSLRGAGRIKRERLPAGFKGRLRAYQKEGYYWILFFFRHSLNGCLADDMGLGKTVQALAALQKAFEENMIKTVLLVVPVSTIVNWTQEIRRFTPKLTVRCHHGPDRATSKRTLQRSQLIITSYHTLRNDIELFQDMSLDVLVLDEAHNIKNAASQTFKAVRSLSIPHKLSLTGTPVENNTLELWTQMNFLNPALLGTAKEFKRLYARPIEKQRDGERAAELRRLVQPFIMRRKKEDVASDLPEKEEHIIYIEMGTKQRAFYDRLKASLRRRVDRSIQTKGVARSAVDIFSSLLKLRQAALMPDLAGAAASTGSCKGDYLYDAAEEIMAEGHKLLVFSQFVQVLSRLRRHYDDKQLPYAYLDGQTRHRDGQIRLFQDNADCRLFLISLKAGGVGINLTAADYVIIFDPWWNPAVESQAIDRSHRIGQSRRVIAYRLIAKGTVEEKIMRLQQQKTDLVKQLITEDASFFKSLDGDAILDLFR
jgi:superfamily II DNA or RNA helicase